MITQGFFDRVLRSVKADLATAKVMLAALSLDSSPRYSVIGGYDEDTDISRFCVCIYKGKLVVLDEPSVYPSYSRSTALQILKRSKQVAMVNGAPMSFSITRTVHVYTFRINCLTQMLESTK